METLSEWEPQIARRNCQEKFILVYIEFHAFVLSNKQFSRICNRTKTKVWYVFPMVIWSEFRIKQYRDADHREDAPHFTQLSPRNRYSQEWRFPKKIFPGELLIQVKLAVGIWRHFLRTLPFWTRRFPDRLGRI